MRFVTLLDQSPKSFHARIYGERIWEVNFDLRRPVGVDSRLQLRCDGRDRVNNDRNLRWAFEGFNETHFNYFLHPDLIDMYKVAWELSTWHLGTGTRYGGWRYTVHDPTWGRMLATLAEHLTGIEQLYIVGFPPGVIKKLFRENPNVLTRKEGSLAERLEVPHDLIDLVRERPETYSVMRTALDKGMSTAMVQSTLGRFPGVSWSNAQRLVAFCGDYGYDMERLCEYLVVECRDYQGIQTWTAAFQLLSDYVRMVTEIDGTPDKYPRSLKRAHDVATMRHRLRINEINAEKFAKRTSSEEYTALTGPVTRDYVVVAPSAPHDLARESDVLHHCVVGYARRISEGEARIYFLRNADDPDTPKVTVQINKHGQLSQARGAFNRVTTADEREALHHWAQMHGVEVVKWLR